MYIEHPFKYDGVYYAKVDGELIEITREQAKVMLSFYRNYKNYDKKWGYRGEEDNDDENSEQKKKKEKEELDSCKELMDDGRVQILGYTKYKEMIRLSGKAYAVADDEQEKWIDCIFEEQPYLANVYPGDTRDIGIIFCIDEAEVEYFNLGVNPIFRERYSLGNGKQIEKGYFITNECIGCGTCRKVCPQRCVDEGTPYVIRQNNCLHCGNCYEKCPVKAVIRK